MRQPPLHASGFTRKSTGLSPAHRELIRLLAEIAVRDYLEEIETAEIGAKDNQRSAVEREAI